MLRFLLLYCFVLSSFASLAGAAEIEFTGTVHKVVIVNQQDLAELQHNGAVALRVAPDPRFLLTLKLAADTGPELSAFSSDSIVTLGIHSPALLFGTSDPTVLIGQTFRFKLEKTVIEGKTSFRELQVAREESSP